MKKNEPVLVAHGVLENENEYAIRLLQDTFINLSSFKKAKGRGFEVFKWRVKKLSNGTYISGWFPWIEYRNKRWVKGKGVVPMHVGPPMVTMHKFFKSTAEFGKWVGEKNFKHLFNELI